MSSRFPVVETVLAGVAGSTVLTLWLLPPTPSLTPWLRPWVLGLSGLWTLWRFLVLERGYDHWQAWRVSPSWITTPAALQTPTGFNLGQGFVWTATQVQALEWALWQDGALPLATGPRGGYPALQAVGRHEEQDVVVSWELAKRHTGLMGTTGSGKSRELESLLAQAIGEA